MKQTDAGELIVHIEGIGWSSPGLADWSQACALLRAGETLPIAGACNPTAAVLPANERRRAPAPVRLACEVAAQACAMAERAPESLRSVFASMHGDVAITDELCSTLASAPLETSPTRFHNSVHNAPVGHWTVAVGSHAASSAVSAWRGSFAAGLLESALLACADDAPVLFAAYDIAAPALLAGVLSAARPFGVALVLNPERSPQTRARLRLRHQPRAETRSVPNPHDEAFIDTAPIAAGLPLFAALAQTRTCRVELADGAATSLAIEVEP